MHSRVKKSAKIPKFHESASFRPKTPVREAKSHLDICRASPVEKIPRPVETASSATSLKSELFAKNFVFRVFVNIDLIWTRERYCTKMIYLRACENRTDFRPLVEKLD